LSEPASAAPLSALALANWRPTRDRLHRWARLAGAVRRQRAPRRDHWWHSSLQVSARGLTTGPFPAPGGAAEILLDLVAGNVLMAAADGWELRMPLASDPAGIGGQRLLEGLIDLGLEVELPSFAEPAPGPFDDAAAARYLAVLVSVDGALKQLQAQLPGSTSPVQLWPHHFDLSLTWLSGRQVIGQEGAEAEERDEQVGLGFSTGEETDADPYLYAICHPWPDGVEAQPPSTGSWHSPGWRGAVLPWAEAATAADPVATAVAFWSSAQRTFAEALAFHAEPPPAAL
jgi:hypothetical protein